ncbi:MAG: SsrA-binding protein [Desulfococcus sp. 4484_241]|nr:MAG: SsrA-binding protein [Desulfococcus sp. 4484_241]RLC31117.1 MAG: SsrA-binding protein [Deltaproteobacteria bacterium]
MEEHIKIVTENKKARHEFFIEEEFEAGMSLLGTEVKSLRQGRANLKDSYAKIKNGELFLYQMHISPYPFAHHGNHDPERPRKLLVHKRELKRLFGKINEKGYSLVPLKVYFKSGKAKVLLAIARGKRKFDKRDEIKKKDAKREMDRALKRYR